MDLSIFRDPTLAKELIERIHNLADGQSFNFMEVCGTHTVSIARYGFRSMLPKEIKLLSGPGCPVCVTADEDIDYAIALADVPNTIITSFGDMLRVPGSYSSLNQKKAEGKDVRVCYSPLDALAIAQANPCKEVIFIGVGFETTAPIIAASILQAQELGLKNFSVFSSHKTMPNALKTLVDDPDLQLHGLILPGHVSTIIGKKPYEFLAQKHNIPGVITGFEPVDVLSGILQLLKMAKQDEAAIANAYPRGVKDNGNPAAQSLISSVFTVCDAPWRGLGIIPGSGLEISDAYSYYDARKRFILKLEAPKGHKGCKCGEILRGILMPNHCPLFGKACTPEKPVGPCMVSSEGSCAAFYRYKV